MSVTGSSNVSSVLLGIDMFFFQFAGGGPPRFVVRFSSIKAYRVYLGASRVCWSVCLYRSNKKLESHYLLHVKLISKNLGLRGSHP